MTREGPARAGARPALTDETTVLPAVRLPVPLGAHRMADRHAVWLPNGTPFLVGFVVVLGVLALFSQRSTGPLGPVVTVLWSLPVVGTALGLTGAGLTWRRLRRIQRGPAAPTVASDRLVVVVPTIGRYDTYPALDRAVRSYLTFLPECFPRLRIDIVIEEECEAALRIATLARLSRYVRVVTVPRSYRTPNGTRFKARANHYAHQLRIAQGEDRDDVWILHMDDDTAVGADTAQALAQLTEGERGAPQARRKHLAQGILTYPRENARHLLTWLADASRPVADITTYAAVTGAGTPWAGLHGELLLVRASIEATIGWDFGPTAIVEDAQFALIYSRRYPGTSTWFAGRCYGASPASISDFLRQRERWSWGLVGLAFNDRLPLRDRLIVGYLVVSWLISPALHIVPVLLLGVALGSADTVPVTLAVLPVWALNMAYAIWLYWEGLHLNVGASADPVPRLRERLLIVALIPLFSAMEALGAMRGLYKHVRGVDNQFVVIAKPL